MQEQNNKKEEQGISEELRETQKVEFIKQIFMSKPVRRTLKLLYENEEVLGSELSTKNCKVDKTLLLLGVIQVRSAEHGKLYRLSYSGRKLHERFMNFLEVIENCLPGDENGDSIRED